MGGEGWRSDFFYSLHVLFIFLFIYFYYYFLFFIPLTCIRYIFKKTSVTTQATVNYEIHASVSVKRHICDVKICG